MERKSFKKLMIDLIKVQLLLIISSFIMLPIILIFSGETLKIIIGIFSFVMLLYLSFQRVKNSGSDDKIKVNANKMKYSPLKGMLAALILSGIWIFLSLINLFIKSTIINYIIIVFNLHLVGFYTLFELNHYTSIFIITLVAGLIWSIIALIAYLIGFKKISAKE